MFNSKLLKTGAAVLLVCVASAAYAGPPPSVAGTLTVNATVTTDCLVNSPTLTFPAIDPTTVAAAVQGNASIQVTCTKGTTAATVTDIKLNGGANLSGGSRFMKEAGGATLAYQLCVDAAAACATPWGDGVTAGIGAANPTPFSSAFPAPPAFQSVTVNGVVSLANAQAAPASASYTDSVTITVDF